jgi:hypothetical protein
MRSTVVPAQVTTVEDRIMGSLGFSQVALVVLPGFIAAAIFAFLPPFMHGSVYKYVACVIIALLMCSLAIRIKGKIVLFWLITIIRYNLRPKYYLFNKNTLVYREDISRKQEAAQKEVKETKTRRAVALPRLAPQDTARVLETIQRQNSNLRFEMTKKGGLRVRFSQIED